MRLHPITALSFLLLATACAVRHEGPNGITIEVDANQPEAAEIAAREHCDKFGKRAVLVRTSDPAPSPRMLYLESQIAVFDCVAR